MNNSYFKINIVNIDDIPEIWDKYESLFSNANYALFINKLKTGKYFASRLSKYRIMVLTCIDEKVQYIDVDIGYGSSIIDNRGVIVLGCKNTDNILIDMLFNSHILIDPVPKGLYD